AAIGILVELAFQFCRINDKRRGRQRPEWMKLGDEESSGPIAPASAISSEGGVGPAGPIEPAGPINNSYCYVSPQQQPPQNNFGSPAPRQFGPANGGTFQPQKPPDTSPNRSSHGRSPFDDVLRLLSFSSMCPDWYMALLVRATRW